MNTLFVETPLQAILFNHVLLGQMTDGMWENSTPSLDIEKLAWCEAKVEAGKLGRNYSAKKTSYAFNKSELFELIADDFMKAAHLVDPNATEREVRKALTALTKLYKKEV